MSDILRTLDAMSFVKVRLLRNCIVTYLTSSQLGTLYWHVIDSQSFPLEVEAFPALAEKGAYSSSEIYTQQDVKDIILYANEVSIS